MPHSVQIWGNLKWTIVAMPNFETLPEFEVRGMEETKDSAAGAKMGNGGAHYNEEMYQSQKSEYPLPYFYKDKNIYANIYKVEVL